MRIVSMLLTIFCMGFASFAFAANANNSEPSTNKQMLLANSPPGLQKKGMSTIPYSGKVPPGWSQGVKRGWNKDKSWQWNKETKLWENKNWIWDSNTHSWKNRHND